MTFSELMGVYDKRLPMRPQPNSKRYKDGRPPFRAARAFYLTLFIGVSFATFALFTSDRHSTYESFHSANIYKRSLEPSILSNADEQCRLVHRAKDQCAFVHSQCPEEEAGFAAYLDLYYCRLPHLKPLAFTILISWLGLLFSTIGIAASDFFCINLSTIATMLGLSESMAGVTFLAFGNGSPDVFSTFAAMSTNSGSLAVGELFGAAGFITAVVSGSMALIRPFHVARKSFVRDVGFFVVAAAFSIVFLWDGKLHFWECLVMVAYYCFYVAFVVAWHWWLERRRRKRDKERAAREHYILPEDVAGQGEEEWEPYRDDPDDNPSSARPSTRPSPIIRGLSWNSDFSALERGGGEDDERDEDEEEEARDRWMADLNSNMRLTRPPATTRPRKSTLTPVRPSLVGALEFQAVLKSLQKSRNIQTFPMNSRRYSDDPTYTTAQLQDGLSSVSDPASRPPYEVVVNDGESPGVERAANLDVPASAPLSRNRANSSLGIGGSANHGVKIDPDLQRIGSRSSQEGSSTAEEENLIDFGNKDASAISQSQKSADTLDVPTTPSVEISPATPRNEAPIYHHHHRHSRQPSELTIPKSPDLLVPPPAISRQLSSHSRRDSTPDSPTTPLPDPRSLPKITIPGRERSRSRSRSRSPAPSPSLPRYRDDTLSPFPKYHDDPSPPGSASRSPSFRLPPPASPESVPVGEQTIDDSHGNGVISKRPTLLDKWWPHSTLPPPGVLISTLFPTIYHWREKNYWEMALGIVAAPSVFLLTITLPVVESGKDEESDGPAKDASLESATSKAKSHGGGRRDESLPIPIKGSGTGNVLNDPVIHIQQHGPDSTDSGVVAEQGANIAHVAAAHEDGRAQHRGSVISNNNHPQQSIMTSTLVDEPEQEQLPDLWNRWLLILQLFLAPLFIVFAIYSQSPVGISPSWLIKPILICLLVSLVLLVPLLLTTTPTHKPAVYRYILSLVGFVVSIAWISTIAGQVVGALKALAVILNMSHAIMGLTIFAVGNSLGDLVADVTVAKLGYPVMALSACFGGPMLNILLGIGLSGSYIMIRGDAKHRQKHPDESGHWGLNKAYHIEVSNTLLVSGATLLVTLVGLLIVVPMNRWVFSKRIGWALIVVWVLSTVGNVVLEVTGFADE